MSFINSVASASFSLCVLTEASVCRPSKDLTTAANDQFYRRFFWTVWCETFHDVSCYLCRLSWPRSFPCLSLRACLCACMPRINLLYQPGIGIMFTCCLFTSPELPKTTSWSLIVTQGGKKGLEAVLFLIGPLIECHSGKPQGAGWIKLSRTQVRLR